ncbi:MAG: hypothetical protein Kow0045_18580 [Albidovulum sp.]
MVGRAVEGTKIVVGEAPISCGWRRCRRLLSAILLMAGLLLRGAVVPAPSIARPAVPIQPTGPPAGRGSDQPGEKDEGHR